MKILASDRRLAWLVGALAMACSNSSAPPAPDYDSLRKEDDKKHGDYPPPPAAPTNQGWPSLAPAPGSPINVGITPTSGTGGTGGSGAGGAGGTSGAGAGGTAGTGIGGTGGMDAGVDARDSGPSAPPDSVLSSYVTISGGTRPGVTFVDDPSLTITRTGSTLFTIRSTTTFLPFTWTATNANLAGYAIQFGVEPMMYYRSSSTFTSGSSSIGLYMQTVGCSQLPSTCYVTNMKLYAIGLPYDGGVSYGISAPSNVSVAIDCGGCP